MRHQQDGARPVHHQRRVNPVLIQRKGRVIPEIPYRHNCLNRIEYRIQPRTNQQGCLLSDTKEDFQETECI